MKKPSPDVDLAVATTTAIARAASELKAIKILLAKLEVRLAIIASASAGRAGTQLLIDEDLP
jgi:hypothetical protein